jgi:ATP-dependent helicase/nuclease subunit B
MSLQTFHLPLDPDHSAASIWTRIAECSAAWLKRETLAARDAIVLLPFSQHLPLARRAWAALDGWPPRLETTRTLALSFGPEIAAGEGEVSFDMATDQLAAAQLLRGQTWAADWQRRDARSFQWAVKRMVETAHGCLRCAAQQAPDARAAFWERARQLLAAGGPGEMERALARIALEWAAAGNTRPLTDTLFGLQPSSLIVVQAGGADPLCEALIDNFERQGCPILLFDTDLQLDLAFEHGAPQAEMQLAVCEGFEDEAQATAAAVLAHVNQGQVPVALIAQDRMLMRRVRALLDRSGVSLADETGWTLSTLPAATQLMAMLRAAQARAGLDAWLDWLKSDLAQGLADGETSLVRLEGRCRRQSWRRVESVQIQQLEPDAASLWQRALDSLRPIRVSGRRSLGQWLDGLRDSLNRLQAWPALQQLPAGPQVIEALSLSRTAWPGTAQYAVQQACELSLSEFIDWVDECLEAQQYVPQAGAHMPQVHITPLARAMLRPFAAVVLPAADAKSLGAAGGASLMGEAVALALGLPNQVQRRQAQLSAFAQLLRAPALTLLRRRSHGAEPLSPSPLLERLELALQAFKHAPLQVWRDPREQVPMALAPSPRARAAARGRLPNALSASAVESLRSCPYQFFSRVMLGLRESDELEATIEKRDYGSWLHGVLNDFHRRRSEQPAADELVLLQQAAQAELDKLGLDEAAFLPYSSSFERFVPRYLEWLHGHEAQGAMWAEGELDREVKPAAWQGGLLSAVSLRGRLDRVDLLSSGEGTGLLLIDYKTGSIKGLKDKVAAPLEDSQLAIYAALMDAQPLPGVDVDRPMRALYLALDDTQRIEAVEHADVLDSAQALLQGLGQDLLAIHDGQSLPALGEGQGCDYCEMRGLCRRDDWDPGTDCGEAKD